MLPNTSDKPLTPGGQKLCARALKHLRVLATHSDLSLEEAAAQVIALALHPPRPGRKPFNWEAATGCSLSRLTPMILMEQAIAKGSAGTRISEQQALGRIVTRRQQGARTRNGDAVGDIEKLLKAYQHAVRNPPEMKTDRQRQDLRRAVAWLDHLERRRRRKQEPDELNHLFRPGPSWVRVGATLIVNGQQITAEERPA